MLAYWLLYDVLKEEGQLEQYGFDSLGDPIPYMDEYLKDQEITGNVEINVDLDTERPKFKFDEDVVLSLMKDLSLIHI